MRRECNRDIGKKQVVVDKQRANKEHIHKIPEASVSTVRTVVMMHDKLWLFFGMQNKSGVVRLRRLFGMHRFCLLQNESGVVTLLLFVSYVFFFGFLLRKGRMVVFRDLRQCSRQFFLCRGRFLQPWFFTSWQTLLRGLCRRWLFTRSW